MLIIYIVLFSHFFTKLELIFLIKKSFKILNFSILAFIIIFNLDILFLYLEKSQF